MPANRRRTFVTRNDLKRHTERRFYNLGDIVSAVTRRDGPNLIGVLELIH